MVIIMNISIYIATHKKFDWCYQPGYQVLQVGAKNKKDLGYLKDDSGDNISDKNPNYCELTGLYWIWKNDHNSDTKGLVHYRRYFSKAVLSRKPSKFISVDDIKKDLENYDIILPKREWLKETAWEEYYMVAGLEKDLQRVKDILQIKYPEYLSAFGKYFNSNQTYLYNMMICRKELFDNYCEWLFDILFELEKQVDYNDYNDYQKRIFGFMSERLLNVWVMHNQLSVKEYRTVNTEMKRIESCRIFLRRIKNRVVFFMR